MSEDKLLHTCSPYFLTRPLCEQPGAPTKIVMSDLARKVLNKELQRIREINCTNLASKRNRQ